MSADPDGQHRIDDFPVGRRSYNVPLYNVRLKNLEDARGIMVQNVIETRGVKISVAVIEQKNKESIKR